MTAARLIAAGAFAMAVGAWLAQTRLDTSDFYVLLVSLAFLAPVAYALSVTTDRSDRRAQAVLVGSLILLITSSAGALANLLSSGDEPSDAITTLTLAAITGTAAYIARREDSGLATLLAGIGAISTAFYAVYWIADPEKLSAYRWVAFLLVLGLTWVASVFVREGSTHHGTAAVEAAGVALLVLTVLLGYEYFASGLASFFAPDGGDGSPSQLWNLVPLLGAAALVAYGVYAPAPGASLLGVLAASGFTVLEFNGNLLGWPLILGVGGAAAILYAIQNGDGAGTSPVTTPPPPPPVDTAATDASTVPSTAPPTAEDLYGRHDEP